MAEDLLKQVDEEHKAGEQASEKRRKTNSQNMGEDLAAPGLLTLSKSPIPSLSPTTITTKRRRKKSKAESEIERPNMPLDRKTLISLLTGEESDSEEEAELYVQRPLPRQTFVHEDLREHLKTYRWTEAGQTLLEEVVVDNRLVNPAIFHDYSAEEEAKHHSHYTIFDVGNDGAPLNRRRTLCLEEKVDGDKDAWAILQNLNADFALRPVVGRISLIREPTPVILGVVHLAMNNDFDMDELFGYLIEEDNSAAHVHNRMFSLEERHQRSIVFKFDYFTVVGKDLKPMPWQRSDNPEKMKKRSDKHIPISRCSSVVALSLSGDPTFRLKNVARRAKTTEGFIFNTWAPWHVLNIQCYPDHEHTMDSHDSTKHYVNGPEAFLHTLLAEFKDARKRFKIILNEVTKLVVPPPHFMFDGELRDKLLFEDDTFTYSRRYFWAFQTLGLMTNAIKSIINEYEHTFTDDVWAGKHKSLWPLIEDDNARRKYYWRHRLLHLKKDFENELQSLQNLLEANESRREEIKALEIQLFQGTSVLESRKSVELAAVTILQGHNIKLLTLVTIFFLPLTFVTSVFGMANIPSEHFFKAFAITMATVCVPFFLLIGSLNTTSGMEFWRVKWQKFTAWIRRDRFVWNKPEPDNIGPGNPRVRRRSHSILQTTRAIQIRKTESKDEGIFHSSLDIRNQLSAMPHLRQDRLSADFTASDRRPSRGSERRRSNTIEMPANFMMGERRASRAAERCSSTTMELKPQMSGITSAFSKEEAVDLSSDHDNPPYIWGKIWRKKSTARHDVNV